MKKNRIEKRLTIRIPAWMEEEIKEIQEEYKQYEWTKTDIVQMAVANYYKQLIINKKS